MRRIFGPADVFILIAPNFMKDLKEDYHGQSYLTTELSQPAHQDKLTMPISEKRGISIDNFYCLV
jgi:hypothetical protein